MLQVIHQVKCGVVSEDRHWFELHIVAQAGTYIKEFCHGDFGRTTPDVGGLLGGCDVQIVELDVEHVHLDVCTEPAAAATPAC